MTRISTHVYAARESTTDTVLSPTRGSVTLDADNVPHVTAQLTLAVEDPLLLNVLDPRAGRRVEITAVRDGGTPRVFDLGIRTVTPDRAAGTVEVEAASDEAILTDVAVLDDDKTPRALESSLRAVVDYVLGKIDAALEPGTVDADVTAYWPLTNLMTNPSVANTGSGYTAGTNTSSAVRNTDYGWVGSSSIRWASAASGVAFLHCRSFPVEAGQSYVMSTMILTTAGRQVRMVARWRDPDGNIISDNYGPETAAAGTSEFVRVSHIAVAPEGASNLSFNVALAATASGQACYADGFMLYEGDELVDYFDGSTVPDGYLTVWDDTPHASTSRRIPLLERDPESTTWSAGASGMEFLHTLLSAGGLRLVCDEQRRWTLRDADYRAEGNLSYRYGINITAADEKLSRDDETWFDAAVYDYTWTTPRDGREHRRTDAFALVDPPTKVLRVELRDTPFPGPGRAEHIVRRAQGKGREVTVSGIPSWRERTDQPITVTLDGTPIQTGIAAKVVFDLDTDEVTVTSRTSDTPASAWTLLGAGQSWLDSPTGESWTEEVI